VRANDTAPSLFTDLDPGGIDWGDLVEAAGILRVRAWQEN